MPEPQLPNELWDMICHEAHLDRITYNNKASRTTLYALSETSKAIHATVAPLIYRHLPLKVFPNLNSAWFQHCFAIVNEKRLAKHVRSLHIPPKRSSGGPAAGDLTASEIAAIRRLIVQLSELRSLDVGNAAPHGPQPAASKLWRNLLGEVPRLRSLVMHTVPRRVRPLREHEDAKGGFRYLRHLEMRTSQYDWDESEDTIGLLHEVMTYLKNIESLTLSGSHPDIPDDLSGTQTFPERLFLPPLLSSRLHELSLTSFDVDGRQLITLLNNCKDTLTHVALSRIHLWAGTWEDIFQFLQTPKHPACVHLDAIGYPTDNWFHSPWWTPWGRESCHLHHVWCPERHGNAEPLKSIRWYDYHALGDLARLIESRIWREGKIATGGSVCMVKKLSSLEEAKMDSSKVGEFRGWSPEDAAESEHQSKREN